MTTPYRSGALGMAPAADDVRTRSIRKGICVRRMKAGVRLALLILQGFAMLLVFAHVGVEEQAAKQAQASTWLDGSFCEACFCVARGFS